MSDAPWAMTRSYCPTSPGCPSSCRLFGQRSVFWRRASRLRKSCTRRHTFWTAKRSEATKAPLAGVRGERALNARTLEVIADGETSQIGEERLNNVWGWLIIRPTVSAARATALRWMTQYLRLAALPRYQRQAGWQQLHTEIKSDRKSPLVALLMQPTSKMIDAHDRHLARVRCARVAVAAELYRRSHGKWPEDPSQLVPEFLAEIPTDPFTNAPFASSTSRTAW